MASGGSGGMGQGGDPGPLDPDVLVLGGGMAGWATAKLLAERGCSVELIDDAAVDTASLGESLEFSAPHLLAALGLDPEELVAEDDGYAKTNVFIEQMSANEFEIWPPGWFRHPPLFGSHFTLHIDRPRIDERLRTCALAAGVRHTADRVTSVEHTGGPGAELLSAVALRSGQVRRARWYVDATGHRSRLVGRALDLNVRTLGDERVALYRRLTVGPARDVTRLLFSANADDRMTWAWVLPIGLEQVSVGVNVPACQLRAARTSGISNSDVFDSFIAAFPTVEAHLDTAKDQTPIRSRAFSPFVHHRTTGANWILVGDAAALLDPVTSSGVATGLHSAFSADRLIGHALKNGQDRSHARHRRAHDHLTVRTVSVINRVVDRVLHRRGLRALIGTRLAAFTYAITNVLVSAWYSRIRPINRRRILVHGLLLGAAVALSRLALVLDHGRRLAATIIGRRRRSIHSDLPPQWVQAPDHPSPARSG